MSDFMVIGYTNPQTASRVLHTIRQLQSKDELDLDDAAALIKDDQGQLHFHHSNNQTRDGALGGAIWGAIFGTLFVPGIGTAVGTALGIGAGAALGHHRSYDIDRAVIERVSAEMATPGSAVILLLESLVLDDVVPAISAYGGTLLHSSFPGDLELRFQHALQRHGSLQSPTAPPENDTSSSSSIPA